MNICVFTDFRFVTCPTMTGVGKHIIQMVHGLRSINGNSVTALATSDQAKALGPLEPLPVRRLPLPWRVADGLWTVASRPYADRWCGNPDWVYCPKNDFIPIRRSRVAVTVHGAHELDPAVPQPRTVYDRLNRLRRQTAYRRMLGQAHLVLTVSEFLKRQLVGWFKADPNRCCVVGNGVESDFFRAGDGPLGLSGEPLDRPFVLCVGGLNHLDGGDRVLGLASFLRKRARDLRVLVAGSQHEPRLEKAAADLPNVRLLGYVSAERLARYMRDAAALFFPTRYETFGIAAAEAMAVGLPVVTCRCTAVPEIIGDAAIYVDPDNIDEAFEALRALQTQPGLREDLVRLGRRKAQSYTWPACVARLLRALNETC